MSLWWSLFLNMQEYITLHFYSSRISSLSDCSSTFFSSFSYSNLTVKKYWDSICSCMTHLTRCATFSKSSISFLMSICPVHGFCKAAWCFMNLLQCTMTCFTVFLIWSHEQTDDEKLRTQILFRKTTSSLQSVWICMIMKLSVFCSCAWSLIVLQLKDLTSSKFQFESLLVQQHFHLCINACFTDIFTFFSDLSQCSAHWIWHSLTVDLNLLCCNCSLFCICLQDLTTNSFISDCLWHWWNFVSLTFKCRFRDEI